MGSLGPSLRDRTTKRPPLEDRTTNMGPTLSDRTTNPLTSGDHSVMGDSVIGMGARGPGGSQPADMSDQAANTEPRFIMSRGARLGRNRPTKIR